MRRIETYKQLDAELNAWITHPAVDGRLLHLCIIGEGGNGKSQRLTRLLGAERFHDFSGANSAAKMFQDLTDDTAKPILFDDMHSILRKTDIMDIVKQACNIDEFRRVRWNKVTNGMPTITISSKVCILLNRLPKKNADIEAILDRFDVICFAPTITEMTSEAKKIFDAKYHKDIDFIASLNVKFSFRAVSKYIYWKESQGQDIAVRNLLAEFGIKQDVLLMADIIEKYHYKLWIDEFCKQTNRGRKAAVKYWNEYKQDAEQLLTAKGVKLDAAKQKALTSLRGSSTPSVPQTNLPIDLDQKADKPKTEVDFVGWDEI